MTIPDKIELGELKDLGNRGVEWNGMLGRLWFHQVPFIYKKSMGLTSGTNLMEIGTDEGFTAVLLGLPSIVHEQRQVICVDPHTVYSDARSKWHANIKKHGLTDLVSLIEMTSDQAFYHAEGPEWFDLVFVDGDHVFESVVKDVVNAWCRLRLGGLLMVHDVETAWPGPSLAWEIIKPLLTDIENCGSLFCGRKIEIKR
jgi:hypothetical protein